MTQSTRHRVAAEIRAEMGRQEYTQAALAAATGMSQPAISRRLGGEVPFDLDELDALAAVLDVDITVELRRRAKAAS